MDDASKLSRLLTLRTSVQHTGPYHARVIHQWIGTGHRLKQICSRDVSFLSHFSCEPAFTAAVLLQDVSDLVRLLDEYRIEATLLSPTSPAIGLFDRMEGWERVYADDHAVVHLYRGKTDPKVSPGWDVRSQAISPH